MELFRWPYAKIAAVVVLLSGCSDGAVASGPNDGDSPTLGSGGATSSSGGASGSPGNVTGSAHGGDAMGVAGEGKGGNVGGSSSSAGDSGSSGGSSGSSAGGGSSIITGGPGCGLATAAFCDTFDAPSANRGRAGELDRSHWSGARMAPQGPTAGGQAFGVRAATLRPLNNANQLPACRSGLTESVFPPNDALICDPSTDIASHHLLVAVASQNYGQNSYRIRQPFDFAGRTGKIVFDAEGLAGGLLGWVSIDVTEDPIGAPSFQSQHNYEGGVLPRNGLSIQFNQPCEGGAGTEMSVSELIVFDDYVASTTNPSPPTCAATRWGKLNHFEIDVSQSSIKVFVTPFSNDGTTSQAPVQVFGGAVSLPFSRGYVHITTHNHATLKYSAPASGFGRGFTDLDAWIARWDNVGFDGPVLGSWREQEAPDPLEPSMAPGNVPVVNTGFRVADEANGPSSTLHFQAVDLTDLVSARIALDAWYCTGCGDPASKFVLKYRLNGNAWHERSLNPAELADVTTGNGQGAVGEMLDIPLKELKQGDNTLQLVTANVPQNYPPGVANVDLVLETK